MYKKVALWLKALFLISSLSSTVSAGLVTVTIEGTLVLFNDPSGLLPFTQPADGSTASFSAIIDTDALTADSINLTFAGQNYSGYNGPLYILNDFPNVLGAARDFGAYADLWNIPTVVTESGSAYMHEFGVVFGSFSDELPVAPLTGTEFIVPDPSDWDIAGIYYTVWENTPTGTNTLANIHFQIDTVTTSQVPLPGAIWLFGSALFGLMNWKRLFR